MKAFVTGSTGLLGSNLVQALLAQGFEVKALARSRQKAEQVFGKDTAAHIIVGDMEDVDSFTPELADCDVLFHTAAYFREYFGAGDHWPLLKKINVAATIRLLDQAEKQGIKKTIYVSSATVIGEAPQGQIADESTLHNMEGDTNLYRKSKIMAEAAIAEWLKVHKMPVVLVLPTAIIGPMDAAPTTMGQAIVNLLNARIPVIPPGGLPLVDARDIAQAMINAVERGKSGERYILAEGYHSFADLVQTVERFSGIPGPQRSVPFPIMLGGAWILERIATLRGKTPTLTVATLRATQRNHRLTAQKAIRDLGITFRSFEDSVRDEVAWFMSNGYIEANGKTSQRPAAESVQSR